MSAGHVFVTRADLTRLDCDAWLLPADEGRYVAPSWREHLPAFARLVGDDGRLDVAVQKGWGHDDGRTARVSIDDDGPVPWLTNVGGWEGIEVEWYLEAARQFVRAASTDVAGTPPRHQRARHLLALPVVGTGFGGAQDLSGDMLMELLALMHRLAEELHVDLVLVTKGEQHFAAAQRARQRAIAERLDGDASRSWALPPALLTTGERLAEHARAGRLVLFLGAGISTGAGLPTWHELLDHLETEVGFDAEQRAALHRLDALDRARLVELRLDGASTSLGAMVSEEMASEQYALAHSLLASLPVDEIVTTNYDDLFERAAADADHPAVVLPYEPSAGARRWLLKLHGSVDQPDDIVLTRADYLRYADRRAALAGIVQALLITRHMLFVGFSLNDNNFHRIVDEVRKAVHGRTESSTASRFGTSVHLLDDPLLEQLWATDLETIGLADPSADGAEAARTLDVLLDFVLARSSDSRAHVLDDDFLAVLTPEEKQIRIALRRLRDETPADARATGAWAPIARLLREYGADQE